MYVNSIFITKKKFFDCILISAVDKNDSLMNYFNLDMCDVIFFFFNLYKFELNFI